MPNFLLLLVVFFNIQSVLLVVSECYFLCETVRQVCELQVLLARSVIIEARCEVAKHDHIRKRLHYVPRILDESSPGDKTKLRQQHRRTQQQERIRSEDSLSIQFFFKFFQRSEFFLEFEDFLFDLGRTHELLLAVEPLGRLHEANCLENVTHKLLFWNVLVVVFYALFNQFEQFCVEVASKLTLVIR